MIFLCVSGGGLKSAAWTMHLLQTTDSMTNGQFFRNTALITGASGGIMGASYFRELKLRQQQGDSVKIHDPGHVYYVSRDLLNPISFAIVTNDLFLPFVTFKHGGYTYKKDRGYIFEKTLNENTFGILDKTIGDYTLPEKESSIPMLIVSPSIVNDGRRLLIASQPVSFLMIEPIGVELKKTVLPDAVDFGRMFEKQGAQSLRFTTALRMNATYPYVLPNVYLPSDPQVEVLDAGFRDNFGILPAVRFMQVFRNWIKTNTSGVIMVIVRAYEREKDIASSEGSGVFETIFNPLGIAFNIMGLQDYEHDNNLSFAYEMLGKDFLEIIRFTYIPDSKMEDSPISFYVTAKERADVFQSMKRPEIQQSLHRVRELLPQSGMH
jgi:hypothetical protein